MACPWLWGDIARSVGAPVAAQKEEKIAFLIAWFVSSWGGLSARVQGE